MSKFIETYDMLKTVVVAENLQRVHCSREVYEQLQSSSGPTLGIFCSMYAGKIVVPEPLLPARVFALVFRPKPGETFGRVEVYVVGKKDKATCAK